MARTEHLPIYKASYDLCLYLEHVVHGFSRYHKYTLGTDLRDAARRALKLVVRANAQRDRVATLLELREQLEELKVLLRLGQDLKVFSGFSAFEHAITQVVELAKQNEGWLKSQRQGQGRGLGTPTDENSTAGGGARRREAVIASQRRTWSANEQQDDMGSIGGCALGGPCRDGFLASRA
ncbi:MAG: four helix bundle protein [Gammaproteobacteria bacterium]|nr:MAG: four helix bundle protein [Gammaproteobacteria bacterium]